MFLLLAGSMKTNRLSIIYNFVFLILILMCILVLCTFVFLISFFVTLNFNFYSYLLAVSMKRNSTGSIRRNVFTIVVRSLHSPNSGPLKDQLTRFIIKFCYYLFVNSRFCYINLVNYLFHKTNIHYMNQIKAKPCVI